MLVASPWAYFFVPETKGLTIDQMDYVSQSAAVARKGRQLPEIEIINDSVRVKG